MTIRSPSKFIKHRSCEICDSSDARAEYSDGHGYCFKCQTYFGDLNENRGRNGGKKEKQQPKGVNRRVSKPLFESGKIKPLIKRKISRETCEKYGYTVGSVRNQLIQIAPYYDAFGKLTAQHVRFPNKKFFWRGEAKGVGLFGQHLWAKGGRRLVITEGEIDALSVSQVQQNKWPVVSIPNGAQSAVRAIRDNLEFVESFGSVIICFDNDSAGVKAASDVAGILSPGKANIARLPLKDANEMLQAGRGKEISNCLWQAETFRPDGIISGKELLGEVLAEPVSGLAIPYSGLQEKLKGLRKGELWLFSAGSGLGKTTLVNELAYDLAMTHGKRLGIMAMEEAPARTAQRYVGFYLNKLLHITHDGVKKEDIREAFSKTLGTEQFWLYEHFGSTQIDHLLNKLRYMIVGLGCDFVLLDHISIIVSGLTEVEESERKTIDRFMTGLRSLIEETGAGCLAVVHLKRPGEGKSWNEGRQVSLTDMRGSGSLEQFSDVVISLERDQQGENEDLSTLRVLKNRPIGITGVAGKVRYEHDTGRLTDAECPLETNY